MTQTRTPRPLPADGQAEIRIISADLDAAERIWEKTAAALDYPAQPVRRPTRDEDGVRLYAVVDAPDRPLPGQQDAAEESTAHLMAGPRITVDELAVHCSAAAVWLDQLARAAETPDTPVELADDIETMRREARNLRDRAERLHKVARIIDGDTPLATGFTGGDKWGAAALDTDREDYGGPAIIPTANQLLLLAGQGAWASSTVTYPEGMDGVPRSLLKSWESKTAQQRRLQERNAAIAQEVLRITCERCEARDGEPCRTKNGRAAEQAHTPRQREAEANVDARIGWIGENPVEVIET
ncbi:zinc finger domain-containing protein [Streptomyces fagopyri]|uniref:zinc finger domain-containing protein n=1 Tax=Streptomyces fagopyri TaxID=2662397 RepID=UPI00380BE7EF